MEQKEGRFFPERYLQNGSPLAKDWIQDYMNSLEHSGKSKKTQYEEKRYGEWWKTRLDGKRLSHITPSDLDSVKRELTEKEYTGETIRHYLKFLRHVLNEAIRVEKLDKTPFDRFTMPKVSPGRTRFLTMEEEAALLKALGEPYAQLAQLAILTGLRKVELLSLRWSNVDLEQGFVTLPKTKSGCVQYCPLNQEAQDILRGFSSWKSPAWVFPSKRAKQHVDGYNFYGRIFLPAIKTAKLEGVTWHTLRHTFASRLAMSGQNDRTIADLLWHTGTELVQRYAHLSPTHLRGAVEGVSGYGKISDPDTKPNGEGGMQYGTVAKTVMSASEEGERIV